MRHKVSCAAFTPSDSVQVQRSDLCSSAGDRLVKLLLVVPVLGVRDVLVPVDLPGTQLSLFPRKARVWVSTYVPNSQPPSQYERGIIFSAMKIDGGRDRRSTRTRKVKGNLGQVIVCSPRWNEKNVQVQ